MTFSRAKGSFAPLRLTINTDTISTVVNLREQDRQHRRRRIAAPFSADRLSTTRLSGWQQKGQFTAHPPISSSP
jgi:hypothetical protein